MAIKPGGTITLDMLKKKGTTCQKQLDIFQKEWGESVILTLDNLKRAAELTLDIEWFAHNFLPLCSQEDFDERIAPIREDSAQRATPIWEEFNQRVAPIREEFNRRIDPIREELNQRTIPIRKEFNQRVAPILWEVLNVYHQESIES